MEGVGAWPTAACLSPDQSGKAAIDVGAFSVAAAHGSYCGNPGSCPKGERTMKWTLRRRKQRNAELRQEIQAHLLLAEREGIESGQTEKEAECRASFSVCPGKLKKKLDIPLAVNSGTWPSPRKSRATCGDGAGLRTSFRTSVTRFAVFGNTPGLLRSRSWRWRLAREQPP